jgi:hypothetical protein
MDSTKKNAVFQGDASIDTGVILFLALVACSNAKIDEDERINRIVRGEAKRVRSHPQRKLHTTQETLLHVSLYRGYVPHRTTVL